MSSPAANAAQDDKAFERFVDSQPILNMLALLSRTGRSHFEEEGAWEVCLCAMVMKLEPQCTVQRILEALPYHNDKMDAEDFLNTMAHLGYFCRKAESALEYIDERLLPAVFIPDYGHPSIIIGREADGRHRFYDPISKLVSNVAPSTENSGHIWFFQKYDEQKSSLSKFMRKGSGYSWFYALLRRFNGTFAQVMTAGFILNIIALITPLFIMLVYDRVIAAGSMETLPMLAVGAFIAIGFEWKLRGIRSRGLSWLAGRLDNIVGNRILAHLIGLSPDTIEKASVSAQIARIKTFESVRDFFSGSVFLSVLEAPFVFIAIGAVMMIAGPLVYVPLSVSVAYIALFIYIRQKVKVYIRLAAKNSSARQQFTIETFEKLHGIRGQGLTGKWQQKFRHLSGQEMMSHFVLGWYGILAETCAHTLTVLAAVMTVGFGVHLVWAGAMSAGALVASMILVWRILTPFYAICTMIPRLEQLRNSIHQVNQLMDIETEAEAARSFSRLPRLSGALSFQNVSFKYQPDQDVIFSNLTFEAKAGDLVAITGGNGSGKATILKLLKSLHQPETGTIRLDGFDIRQLDAPHLRRQIAYVPKTPHFFHGSILENLRFSNPLASREDIEKALDLANILEAVQELPKGLDTVIGYHSDIKLTSNMQACLSLARAYLHPAALLLIDELPNKLLSGRTGQNLKDYLARAKGKRTILFCTYREDFMKLADTIVWLKEQEKPLCVTRADFFDNIKTQLKVVS